MSAKPDNKSVKKPGKKKGGLMSFVVGLMIAIGAIVVLPSTLIFAIGMVPTAVAYFVDSSRGRTLGPTVCFLNFAGVLPALLTLWRGSHTIPAAVSVLSQPTVILLMLVPAALGWLLYGYMPLLIGGILRRRAESRIRGLEKEQEALITAWGTLVKTSNGARPADESEEAQEDAEDSPISQSAE